MLKEFREFAVKGNVVDLAVAVIIGGAFGKIVSSLVGDVVMPLVGALLGGVNFAGLAFKIGSATVLYGKFLQSCVDFLIIAWVIFLAVKLINRLKREQPTEAAPAAPPRQEVLLEEIRDLLRSRG
ncbi:MAG: large-conductance mechanosensitive channel protein MscL [Betaproteobacteria bacterium]|nr:large-conductance mechanosensitive channel protein MscL [Betaproteobacteria bacterium]